MMIHNKIIYPYLSDFKQRNFQLEFIYSSSELLNETLVINFLIFTTRIQSMLELVTHFKLLLNLNYNIYVYSITKVIDTMTQS